ncbi:PucR family transcriptional regulator [Nocardia salmonicida]|uniref:PucR family transcriptional regulator n=1 Tax=Nocardia salmonicida TaxID=53431 RepID=UPI0037A2B5F8
MTVYLAVEAPEQLSRASDRIAYNILESLPRRSRRGNVVRDEICAVVADCMALTTDDPDRGPDSRTARIRLAAARWASIGVPIETVQKHVHAGFGLHLDDLEANSAPFDAVRRLMNAMNTVITTVSTTYSEISPFDDDRGSPRTLAHVLLSGRPTPRLIRELEALNVEQFTVLAVAAGPSSPESVSPRELLTLLSRSFGWPIPGLYSEFGGTFLVPSSFGTERIRSVVARTPLTVVAVTVALDRIPSAAEEVHELLDVAMRLRRPPGLYRLADLAIEYQLTRPGPGRDQLELFLEPVAQHPELISTLRAHIDNGLNRRLTSRTEHIHQNTVDYRLRRIYALVGLSAHDPRLIWSLRAALVVRDYQLAGTDHRTAELSAG